MSLSWAESYMGQIRALAGDDPTLMFVGARCVVRDDEGRILLIKRSDTGEWALPAGAMELGESLRECAIREVREETGLVAQRVTPFAIYSRPEHSGRNAFGHFYQVIALACRVDEYRGELVRATEETTDAAFYPVDSLPEGVRPSVIRALGDLERFEASGEFILD